jgi:hypothetical protein
MVINSVTQRIFVKRSEIGMHLILKDQMRPMTGIEVTY